MLLQRPNDGFEALQTRAYHSADTWSPSASRADRLRYPSRLEARRPDAPARQARRAGSGRGCPPLVPRRRVPLAAGRAACVEDSGGLRRNDPHACPAGVKLENFKVLVASGARRAAETLEVRPAARSRRRARRRDVRLVRAGTDLSFFPVCVSRSWRPRGRRRARAPRAPARPFVSWAASTPRCGRLTCRRLSPGSSLPCPPLTTLLRCSLRASPRAARSFSTSSTTARWTSSSRRRAAALTLPSQALSAASPGLTLTRAAGALDLRRTAAARPSSTTRTLSSRSSRASCRRAPGRRSPAAFPSDTAAAPED